MLDTDAWQIPKAAIDSENKIFIAFFIVLSLCFTIRKKELKIDLPAVDAH